MVQVVQVEVASAVLSVALEQQGKVIQVVTVDLASAEEVVRVGTAVLVLLVVTVVTVDRAFNILCLEHRRTMQREEVLLGGRRRCQVPLVQGDQVRMEVEQQAPIQVFKE